MKSRFHKQSGFSLIEMVVAAALFAFVVTSLLGVYMSVLRLDTRTRAQRAVTDNARFIYEFLSKEVRYGHIDYNAADCGGVVTSQIDLCLINQDGESEHIYVENPAALSSGTNLMISKAAGVSTLNSDNVRVTKVKFLVSPSSDPYTPAKAANEQPHVTVILELVYNSARDRVPLSLQSTFSENYYPSRE